MNITKSSITSILPLLIMLLLPTGLISQTSNETYEEWVNLTYDYQYAKWVYTGKVDNGGMAVKTYFKVYKNDFNKISGYDDFSFGERLSYAKIEYKGSTPLNLKIYTRSNEQEKFRLSQQDTYLIKGKKLDEIISLDVEDKNKSVHSYSRNSHRKKLEMFDSSGKLAKLSVYHDNGMKKSEMGYHDGKMEFGYTYNDLGKQTAESIYEKGILVFLNVHGYNAAGRWISTTTYKYQSGEKILTQKLEPVYEKGNSKAYTFRKYDAQLNFIGIYDGKGKKVE